MVIRTKIVATLGPATRDPAMLRHLIQAGCDVFRLNFSHGDRAEKAKLLAAIRGVEAELGTPVAVMADLCGPKIRVGPLADGQVQLVDGDTVTIRRDPFVGTAEHFSTTLPELVDQVRPGEPVLLDDGKLSLEVLEVSPPDAFTCRVVHGGPLSPGKGINLPQTQLALSALTGKDREDADWIGGQDIDYVALSFVRAAEDVLELRGLLVQRGSTAHVVAKIEKPQAVEAIEEIIAATDVVMVARGDLGVEMELPAVPVAQKRIARLCQAAGKPCIIATQMLETMTQAPRPTRAEVSDVANAILDHADAVMLSGETAVGRYPVEAVAMMNAIGDALQADRAERDIPLRVHYASAATTAALAGAVKAIIEEEHIVAAAVFTASGTTARMLAKNRLPVPILGFSPSPATVRRMCLYYGVVPELAAAPEHTREVLDLAARCAVDRGLARPGDKLVVLSGRPIGIAGATNTLVVHTVP
jgi:pyruvate kinase